VAHIAMLSRLSAETFRDPKDFKKLADDVSGRIKKECPEVKWLHSFATLGRFDVVDIVESPDVRQIEKGGDDHPGLWPCDDRDAFGHALQGVPHRSVADVSLTAPSAKSNWRNKWIFNVTHACFGPGASSD
jgi:GYD domain